jgi:DNA-directed RNA polymerase subunit RPC12/RpoP
MLGLIIWGSTGRTTKADTGEFYCPSCRHSSPFTKMKASRWFTLYFIPLFPMENLGEWIVCSHCSGEFDAHVADMSSSEIEQAISPWQCASCGNQNAAGEPYCLKCTKPRPIQH